MGDNPNWPLVEEAWGPYWGCHGGAVPADRYVEVTDRTRGRTSVQRGRQYELDQVRSGEYQLTLANGDGALDPVNASGPWAGHITAFQPYRKRAQWPPTVNLLTPVQATGGDLGGYRTGTLDAGTGILSDTDLSGTGQIITDPAAWQGTRVLAFQVPAGSAALSRIVYTSQCAVAPGQAYSMHIRVRNTTGATSVQVQPHLGWYTAGGGAAPASFAYGTVVTLTGSPTASWTLVTVTATAPATAAGLDAGVTLAAATPTACTVQADGWQLQKGPTVTSWVAPGAWYPLYSGFVERWPSRWNHNGTYGTVEPVCVDTLSLLSQVKLSDPLTQEIKSRNPRFLYTLSDPQGAAVFADAAGACPPLPIGISVEGPGSLAGGTQITAATAAGKYTGSTGTVVTIANPNPGTSTGGGGSFLSLDDAGIAGPADPTGQWSRMIAFRYTGPVPTVRAVIWSAIDNQRFADTPPRSLLTLLINDAGQLQLDMQGPTAGGHFNPGITVCDSNWHLAIASYHHATATVVFSIDGGRSTWTGVPPAWEPTTVTRDTAGAWTGPLGRAVYNYQGDISFLAEFPTALTATDCATLYGAWKSSCAGESTDARYARILRYAGYTGPASIQTGVTTSMGPATLSGQDALSALQAVVETENGEHFVDRAGTLVFRSRAARYDALSPQYTFGERTNLAEWPYEDLLLDHDSTHLSNQIAVTQTPTGQQFHAQDAASVTAHFPRALTRSLNTSSGPECQDAANYLLSRYKRPATRVSTLRLHPSANPSLWPVCLALELGMRIRAIRRPPQTAPIAVDCFIEQIQIGMDDHGDATWTLQCSPADTTPYGAFASWHTTLATPVTAADTTITVNASADTTNPLAAQLAPGQRLVLGQNTGTAETVTISGVGATSPGWTTAVITLTTAATQPHTAGDTVCEPLPAQITDPTVWDNADRFDNVAFAY